MLTLVHRNISRRSQEPYLSLTPLLVIVPYKHHRTTKRTPFSLLKKKFSCILCGCLYAEPVGGWHNTVICSYVITTFLRSTGYHVSDCSSNALLLHLKQIMLSLLESRAFLVKAVRWEMGTTFTQTAPLSSYNGPGDLDLIFAFAD